LVLDRKEIAVPFKFTCPHCGAGYQVKDNLVGKKTRCKKCGETMTLAPVAEETSPGGSPVYRHVARDREFEPATGDGEAIDAITAHIERYIGPVESVFHEIVSDMIHLDVHWIEPTAQRPWHVLFTTGMSERPMTVDPDAEASDYAELVMCLPGDWPLSQEAFEDEDNYWPVRWLKQLARLPHEYESWLGFGHTIPNGDPPEPFAGNTRMCCWMMTPPMWFDDELAKLSLPDGRSIEFLSPLPIYREEMNLKLSKGAEALFDQFEKAAIPIEEIFNPARKNAAKKRFGLL